VTAINIEGVARSFSGTPAVDNVSIAIRDGEFFTLLGPSGCGKTTLLRMVAGFCELDRGRILLGEARIDTLPPHKRNTGMVFQNYAVFPNLTVGDNVAYGLRARKVGKEEIRERVARTLKLVQLPDHGERWPHQLSGGQLQRVAIARALVIEPHVLLLDEPLSNLDAKLRVEMRGDIRKLQKQLGITVLYVTHDQEEALSISDRVAVLSHGRIEQIGSPAEIYNAPGTPFVAEFIGTMNRLDATVAASGQVQVGGSVLAVADAHDLPLGERVLVLVRPEIVELERADGGVAGAIIGEVVAHIFLGAITRVKVEADDHELSADLPGHKAAELPVGSRVAASFPADGGRVLALSGPASVEQVPAGQ
jgi:ABC-type Fe3+/spermidine/putrescine transport system ATPase subunit